MADPHLGVTKYIYENTLFKNRNGFPILSLRTCIKHRQTHKSICKTPDTLQCQKWVGVGSDPTFDTMLCWAFGEWTCVCLPCVYLMHVPRERTGKLLQFLYLSIYPFSDTKMGISHMGIRPNITIITNRLSSDVKSLWFGNTCHQRCKSQYIMTSCSLLVQ